MIYLDTSFLTPLFRTEALSELVENCLARQPPGSLAISHWTRVEFASVVAREVRMKAIDETAAHCLVREFDTLVEDSLHVFIPAVRDFELARHFITVFATGLRGPDALHLAIARNHGVEEILTLDDGLIFAARQLNLKAARRCC